MRPWIIFFCLIALALPTVAQENSQALTLLHDDIERSYILQIPASYDPEQPAPLVVALHWASGTGVEMQAGTGYGALAEEHGAIVLYPDGIDNYWNVLHAEDLHPSETFVDDAGFMRALIALAREEYNIDPQRIHFSGYSNGGVMSLRMLCEISEEIASIAVIGSNFRHEVGVYCIGAQPTPVFIAIGTLDSAFPWAGMLHVRDDGRVTLTYSVAQAIDYLSALNACPRQVPGRERLEGPRSSHAVVLTHFQGCAQDSEVLIYAFLDHDHRFPSTVSAQLASGEEGSISALAWEFMMARHRTPSE